MWFLLNLLPISDWLLYQQGLVMLPCRISSVVKSVTVCHFSYEYLQDQEFPGYAPFCSENVLIFSPSRRFFAYNSIYRYATSIIL